MPVIVLICVISVCAFCGLLGIIGNITDSKKTTDIAAQPTKSASPVNQETPVIRSLVSTKTTNTALDNKNSGETKENKSDDSKTVIVITETLICES